MGINPDIQGLELARLLWQERADELFAGELAMLEWSSAIGLVGEGSECFGYDDYQSRDHDWGPGFCVWLSREDFSQYGDALQKRYDTLSSHPFDLFQPRLSISQGGMKRVGVFCIESFYEQLLGAPIPQSFEDWRHLNEHGLASATNGEVFVDADGSFSRIRNELLNYYPDDIRLRKITRGCMRAAQSGQYNFMRQALRGEELAAYAALAEFFDATQEIVFALAKRYRPFYKWSSRILGELGLFGKEVHMGLEGILALYKAGQIEGAHGLINALCSHIAEALVSHGLSTSNDGWLVTQAREVNAHISDSHYRQSNLLTI
ncbi:MAG: DUF4037 domain-containing protein [Atopobiaceae bacterium]|nr:DUF4037 domain-containing protein [Atopobiaceae bacterium]